MKGFVHIRIDDRLIHGQVATRWSTGLKVNRIMVIDDAVAANDNEKAILRMAAPAGVNTSILPLEKAVANIKNGNYDGQRVPCDPCEDDGNGRGASACKYRQHVQPSGHHPI